MATSKEGNTSAKNDSKSKIKALQEFPPLVYIGKLKRKRSKRLRKGKDLSRILEIQNAVSQIMASVDAENAIPVIISYEQKPKKRRKVKKFTINGWEVNRKKMKKRLKKNGVSHPWL